MHVWVIKSTKTRSIPVHKLDFIDLNYCFWVTWLGIVEMGKCSNPQNFVKVILVGIRNSYPNQGVGSLAWGAGDYTIISGMCHHERTKPQKETCSTKKKHTRQGVNFGFLAEESLVSRIGSNSSSCVCQI